MAERQIGHSGEVRDVGEGTVKMGSCVREEIGGGGFDWCAGVDSDKVILLGEEGGDGRAAEDERETVFVVEI